MRVIEYRYIDLWKQGQFTDFVKKDYVSIQEGLEAFLDGHTQFWRKFLQRKDKKRCRSCMNFMDVTTEIISQTSVLLIIKLRPSEYNRNGGIVLNDTLRFGNGIYRLYCVVYVVKSRYHAYYYDDSSTPSSDEYRIMNRGAEVLIYKTTRLNI
jgi:hypothetical protein